MWSRQHDTPSNLLNPSHGTYCDRNSYAACNASG
jgi:hypothetical protein